MKSILLFILVLVGCATCVLAQQPVEPKYYTYSISGTVTDELGHPAAEINVCWWPVDRPLGGRILCARTDEKGRYLLSVSDVPDKYVVTASNYRGHILGDGKSPGKVLVDEKNGGVHLEEVLEYRSASSEVLTFGAAAQSRTIDMQLILYRWSDADKQYLPVKPEAH